ncbi:hypothetical protein C8R47DRAFT_1282247 [Mycena vitilis]|nr:hypothetical protein C8R47DRAFT_1282247 [Mycena vitilis]
MHPEFQLSKLSELSVSCRRVAILAADPSAPAEVVLDAVEKVHTMLPREADPLRSAQCLLPVVYANLDLRRLPDPDLLTADHPRVFAVVRALDFLRYCEPRLGRAVTRELWPLVWEWAQFIDNHECFHKDQNSVRVQFLSYFALLLKDATTKQVMYATLDVRFFVARALSDLVALSERDVTVMTSQYYSPAILSICHFLFACHDFPEHADELVVGAGGDIGDLAQLLVRYMAVIIRGLDRLGDNADGAVQERLLYTFHNAQQFMRISFRLTGGEPALLWRSMASVGYLTVAVRALETLAAVGTIPLARQSAALCLLQIHDIINSTLKACEIAEALGAGFLRALILCVDRLGTKDAFIYEAVNSFLGSVLLGSTLVHQCMSVLPAALANALEFENISGFASSPCFEKWQVFKTTATTRQQFLGEFFSFVSKRACDNFECDALMKEKTSIKCCSTCRIALYCSRKCQKVSWKDGHRAACVRLQQGRQYPSRTAERLKRFQEFAVLREYQTQKHAILLQKLKYLQRYRDANYCVVMESVNGGLFTPRVAPMSEWHRVALGAGFHAGSKMRNSNAHLEMHVVRSIGERRTIESASFLRSGTSVVTDSVFRIANQLPPGTDFEEFEASHPTLFQEVQRIARLEVVERYVKFHVR